MRLLLDTHSFIWWSGQSNKLSQGALALCQDAGNTLLLSVVSVWEIQIKLNLGKLTVSVPLRELIERHRQMNQLQVLSVSLDHVLALDELPAYHKDPFDRLLIAQARVEGAALVSQDEELAKYPVDVRW